MDEAHTGLIAELSNLSRRVDLASKAKGEARRGKEEIFEMIWDRLIDFKSRIRRDTASATEALFDLERLARNPRGFPTLKTATEGKADRLRALIRGMDDVIVWIDGTLKAITVDPEGPPVLLL